MADTRSNLKRKTKPAKAVRAKSKAAPVKVKVETAVVAETELEAPSQPFLKKQVGTVVAPPRFTNPSPIGTRELSDRLKRLGIRPTVANGKLLGAVNRVKPDAGVALDKLPDEIRQSMKVLQPRARSLHGSKFSLAYFPIKLILAPCGDRFGYMSSSAVRAATALPFTVTNRALLGKLGALMADPGREISPDSNVPAGFTYVGQFVDHDITLDVSSSLDVPTDANTIPNMRSPSLDLDSLYGQGPALHPFLYEFPSSGNPSAIKFKLGTNVLDGPGGPAGSAATPAAMKQQTDHDVPRVPGSQTAVIGDPRNDENLIVVQFHQTMLRFHNAVVDLLLLAGFSGDIFVEAKKVVTQHYQWAVVNDFLRRVCGTAAISAALASVNPAVGSAFRMPVEFSVAAYRFGHSMIRDRYWLSFNFPSASLAEVFAFNRTPELPVHSRRVVDFNAFFQTGVFVPVNNRARTIDSVLANGLESLPGLSGMMAILATRNLLRGLALGLPSGQGMATAFGIAALTEAQLKQGLPSNEIALLDSNAKLLVKQTPLWYYVLREAAVLGGGNQLGPVGARIVAETFVRILKRDGASYLRATPAFTPFLPSATPGDFTFADLVIFAGVTQP